MKAPEQEMVETVMGWVDLVSDAFDESHNRTVLRRRLRPYLRIGLLPFADAIHAARDGRLDAEMALRDLVGEMLAAGEDLPSELRAFAAEAIVRAPGSYPPGRNVADTWWRDIAIVALVTRVCQLWGLKPLRGRATKRPSGCSVVCAALNRKKLAPLSEKQVEFIWGERRKLAQKLSRTIPPV